MPTLTLSPGSPLGKDAEVAKLAEKYNVAPANILISYHINKGQVVLPKSVTPARECAVSTHSISRNLCTSSVDLTSPRSGLESNLKNIVKLTPEELTTLDGLAASGKQMRVNSPAWLCDFVSGAECLVIW